MSKSKSNTNKHAALILTSLAALLLCAPSVRVAALQDGSALSPQEKLGKLIYLKGDDGSGKDNKAVMGDTELELPAKAFPCANCHGLNGEGTSEGGLQPPAITWRALTSPHRSALTGRERGPYDETTLKRAIVENLDPSGARLHPGMPRFELNGEQLSDLIAYLKKLGREADLDPGLTETEMKLGAALPLSGALADAGQDIKAVLDACFEELNRRGGIYGRKVSLVVADSTGTAQGTIEATKTLIATDQVFALVGSFEPGGDNSTNEYLLKTEVPLVGPVTLSPLLSVPPNPYVFYLMPSFGSQGRVLIDYLSAVESKKQKPAPLRVALIYCKNGYDEDARLGIEKQAKAQSVAVVDELQYEAGSFRPEKLAQEAGEKSPSFVFFFGPAADIVRFASAMRDQKIGAGLVSSLILLGKSAFDLPPEIARKTYLSYPAAYPQKEDMSDFDDLVKKSKIELRHAAFQRAAYGAARVLMEGLEQSGRRLSRKELVNSLEQIREFNTGVLPPVTFSPNRRVGCEGSYVVGIDPDKKEFVPLTGWLTPFQTFSRLSGS